MPVVSEQKECDWVVGRYKSHLVKNERSAAKAWILTARSLFPDNFDVQYESFSLHLLCNELVEAAKVLNELISKFPKEVKLRRYLHEMTDVVIAGTKVDAAGEERSPSEQTSAVVKKELFTLLPSPTKKSMLLQASEEAATVLIKCRLLLATVKLFPETAQTFGLDLYDMLSQQPSGNYSAVADNPYRELLVNDVIPLLVESREIHIEHPLARTCGQTMILKTSHLCQWLESVASFYTTLTAQRLLLQRDHPYAGKQGWERLYKLFMMTAEKCGWREVIMSKQIGPHLPASVRWHGLEKISGYSAHLHKFEAPRTVAIACFYISAFLFFEMAWEYCSAMLYPNDQATPTDQDAERKHSSPDCSSPWVLIEEGLTKHLPAEERPSKRRKLEEGAHHQTAVLTLQTGHRQKDQQLVESFVVAIDCWDFLQSNITYRGEFNRLCQQWGAFDWNWLSSFRADMALYKGDHNLAMQILKHEWQRTKTEDRSKALSLRFIVQMVNCSVMLGDIKAACSYASDVISLVPDSDPLAKTSPRAQPPPTQKSARYLRLLRCCASEMLPYCIQVIIGTLKDVAFSNSKNEQALGQLLVLVQHDWPREIDIFAGIITTIQKRRSFNFPEFFKYIVVVDILEEMLYLCNCESLQINLLPQESMGKSRAVTRGVNRGARVDLMGAIEKQVKRSVEPIEPLLRTFFKHERLSIDT